MAIPFWFFRFPFNKSNYSTQLYIGTTYDRIVHFIALEPWVNLLVGVFYLNYLVKLVVNFMEGWKCTEGEDGSSAHDNPGWNSETHHPTTMVSITLNKYQVLGCEMVWCWTLPPTVRPSSSQLTAACGDFEKKEGEEGGCLRRSEEKSNTHISLHFSFKGSLSTRRRALRRRQRCERAQRASITRRPDSRIGLCILPILESGILVSSY